MDLKDYIPVAQFLARMYGPDAEIVLGNTEVIVHVENPFCAATEPGRPVGEWERRFLKEPQYRKAPYALNYRALTPDGDRLRASTLFIQDDKGQTIGFLTVNHRVEELLRLRSMVDTLVNGHQANINVQESKTDSQVYDSLAISIEELVDSVVDSRLASYGVPADRLTPAEKREVVRELEQKGAFLVKGSVPIVSQRLKTSDATIYRYLHQLNGG